MHTDKEKDLLRRYLTEHWMRLEEEYFRPLRPTDLLNLDHLKTMAFLQEGARSGEAEGKGTTSHRSASGGAWEGFANLAASRDGLPPPSKKLKGPRGVASSSSGGSGSASKTVNEEGAAADDVDELQAEIEKLAEEGKELEQFISEECTRLMRLAVLEMSVAEWRKREQRGDHMLWTLYEGLYKEEDDER